MGEFLSNESSALTKISCGIVIFGTDKPSLFFGFGVRSGLCVSTFAFLFGIGF
jgi:hypothetical protein